GRRASPSRAIPGWPIRPRPRPHRARPPPPRPPPPGAPSAAGRAPRPPDGSLYHPPVPRPPRRHPAHGGGPLRRRDRRGTLRRGTVAGGPPGRAARPREPGRGVREPAGADDGDGGDPGPPPRPGRP